MEARRGRDSVRNTTARPEWIAHPSGLNAASIRPVDPAVSVSKRWADFPPATATRWSGTTARRGGRGRTRSVRGGSTPESPGRWRTGDRWWTPCAMWRWPGTRGWPGRSPRTPVASGSRCGTGSRAWTRSSGCCGPRCSRAARDWRSHAVSCWRCAGRSRGRSRSTGAPPRRPGISRATGRTATTGRWRRTTWSSRGC